jgi:hypothetical protein
LTRLARAIPRSAVDVFLTTLLSYGTYRVHSVVRNIK